MAKHWKFEDDEFLVSYFDAVGDYIGEHDFGRPKGAATRRVAALKESGAWDALVKMQRAEMLGGIASIRAEMEYAKALGFRVEDNGVSDEDAECPADIYSGNYPWRRNPFGENPDDFEDDLLNETLALLRLVRLHAPDCKLSAGKGARSRLHSAVDALLSKAGA